MRALHLALTVLLILAATAARADDWPQWRGPGRDGVWHETGVVERFDGPELKPVWLAMVLALGMPMPVDTRAQSPELNRDLSHKEQQLLEEYRNNYERLSTTAQD